VAAVSDISKQRIRFAGKGYRRRATSHVLVELAWKRGPQRNMRDALVYGHLILRSSRGKEGTGQKGT